MLSRWRCGCVDLGDRTEHCGDAEVLLLEQESAGVFRSGDDGELSNKELVKL